MSGPEIRLFHNAGQSLSLASPSLLYSLFLPLLPPFPRCPLPKEPQPLSADRRSGGAGPTGRQTSFGVFSATKSASGDQY